MWKRYIFCQYILTESLQTSELYYWFHLIMKRREIDDISLDLKYPI
jgi:hypothetical protein